MKRALILVSSYFPKGVAISSRMLNFCRLLRDSGYSVHVITGHAKDQEVIPGKTYILEGITYQVVSAEDGSSKESFFGTKGFVKECKRYLDENSVDFVFLTASTQIYRKLQRIISTHKVKYYVEQCEWMDVSTYKFGYIDPRFLMSELLCRKGYYHPDGIVSISRLLDKHYKDLGIRSIRIPTILDVKNTVYETHNRFDDRIHIVFAGSLGGSKELMKPIIEALAEHDEFRNKIIFDVYGPTEKQIVTNIGDNVELLNSAGNSIVIHGRIPQEQIPDVYSNSDYLIFVRPQRQSSNAGFPTKFAESMAVGTPVITNKTGDIGLYLKNGENGFLLPDNNTEAVCECFERLLKISSEEYARMRRAARETAEENFDYRVYIEEVSHFFSTK